MNLRYLNYKIVIPDISLKYITHSRPRNAVVKNEYGSQTVDAKNQIWKLKKMNMFVQNIKMTKQKSIVVVKQINKLNKIEKR